MKGQSFDMSAKAIEQFATGPEEISYWDRIAAWASDLDSFLVTGMAGLGLVQQANCEFMGTWKASDAAKAVQQLLKAKGATNLVTDGIWGRCSEDAFKNMFGEPLSKESLERLLGVKCGEFTKSIYNSMKPCAKPEQAKIATVAATTTQQQSQPASQQQSQQAAPSPDVTTTLTAESASKQQSQQQSQQQGQQQGQQKSQQKSQPASTIVAGVPNWALGAGAAALVAGAVWFYTSGSSRS